MQADEAHSSEPASDAAIAIRGLYIDAGVVEEAAESLWHVRTSVVFERPLIDDSGTITRLLAAHVALARDGLEAETGFRTVIMELLKRYATPAGPERTVFASTHRISRARDQIHDRAQDELSLAELGDVAGLSRYHLIRMFSQRYGLTPFAYQRTLRVRRAREQLVRGSTSCIGR